MRTIAEINQAIKLLKETLKMPEGVVETDGNVTGGKLTPYEAAAIDPSNVLKSGIPLRSFHLIRMPNNEANPIFRSILARTLKMNRLNQSPNYLPSLVVDVYLVP